LQHWPSRPPHHQSAVLGVAFHGGVRVAMAAMATRSKLTGNHFTGALEGQQLQTDRCAGELIGGD